MALVYHGFAEMVILRHVLFCAVERKRENIKFVSAISSTPSSSNTGPPLLKTQQLLGDGILSYEEFHEQQHIILNTLRKL